MATRRFRPPGSWSGYRPAAGGEIDTRQHRNLPEGLMQGTHAQHRLIHHCRVPAGAVLIGAR
jgi:hypothetical protein